MGLTGEVTSVASYFSHENLDKLADTCIDHYQKSLEKKNQPTIRERRNQLAQLIRKYHRECETLSPRVEEAISNLESGSCLLLMTAHQPNLFAYSGVIRKATLNHVLAQKLSERLNLPVVSFFGIADQDFSDDRWVRSALLPDVERRNGLFELRFDMPEKLMLNRVAKPSRKILGNWRNEIEKWMARKLNSISRDCKTFGLKFKSENSELTGRFMDFWSLVEDAYERAENYADFNSFITSKIVNEVWGYDTVFSRFSECQQLFESEFRFLLSKFDEYSQYVKEATASTGNSRGVQEEEFKTVPFWYHCSCGSKARLKAKHSDGALIGQGQCIRCGKEYLFDFGSKHASQVSAVASHISARSLSMPLVLFHGLGVDCYVGGVGGTEYLKQARFVAEHLNMKFPPVVVWRPRDAYFGVGQLEALMLFRKLSGTFDFSQYEQVEADLRAKAGEVQRTIDELEEKKKQFCAGSGVRSKEQIENLKALSMKQNEVRREANYSVLTRNLGLLENVAAVMDLYPCIVDYAVNVGLKETSEQWIAFLRRNGNLSSNVSLKTRMDNVVACALSVLACE